jgi:tight adherence protein C
MVELATAILVFVTFVSVGVGVSAARQAALARAVRRRLHQGDTAAPPAPRQTLQDWLGRVGKAVSPRSLSRNLQDDMIRAGLHGPNAAWAYLGAKALLAVVGAAGAYAATLPLALPVAARAFWVLAGLAGLSFLPNAYVRMRRQRRAAEIRSHLADAVDLLEICVSSGMGIDQAWNSVADEIRRVSPTLADEMALANLEIHLGVPRATAMRHMAQRTGAGELSSLVAMLVQTERFGTSICDALRTFAQSMREGRSQRAQEAAEKMSIKLLFPMVLFIFPAVVIVMAGPAAIQLFKAMSN